jgi:hypothetical protein
MFLIKSRKKGALDLTFFWIILGKNKPEQITNSEAFLTPGTSLMG